MSDFTGRNLASKYSHTIDERFTKGSQIFPAVNHSYDFNGDLSVKVYSFPIAPMNDYSRSGSNRYGTPMDMTRNVQVMTITQDRSFSEILDKGDLIESEMINTAAKSLRRQIDEVIIPEFDTYVFRKLAEAAIDNGSYASTSVTKSNAFQMLSDAIAYLGNHNVPDTDRTCFCTYTFGNFLMQDSNFIKASDVAQNMLMKGYVGTVMGIKIVLVPNTRLPSGAAFLLVHKDACTAPQQLQEYKIHDNPPGCSGNLIEGRFIYDAFILDEKKDAIYYHGGQAGLRNLPIVTACNGTGSQYLVINGTKEASTNKWYYKTAASKSALPAVTYNTAIDVTSSSDPWYQATEMTSAGTTFSITSGHTYVRVVEIASNNKPVAVADKPLRFPNS